MATASSIPSFATGRGKSNGFLKGFVNDYLANHSEAQDLVRLKEGSQRFLRFDDIERVTEIYCDYKGKNGEVFDRTQKRRRDNFKNSINLSEKKGLLKKVGFGTKSGKEYFKYEIKNDKLWDSLKQKYSVSRKFHKKEPISCVNHDGPSSDTSGQEKNSSLSESDISKRQSCLSTEKVPDAFKQVNPFQSKKDNSKPLSSFSTVSEMKEEDAEEDDYGTILEKKFLDSEYSIKDEVHEKLKRFSWLSGEYGFIGANKRIPHVHFYITVKNEANELEVLEELGAAFDCKANKCFELRREPKTPKKFKYLARPGGGIVSVDGGSNPLRVPDIVNEVPGTLGTLTMFCFKKGSHYALTCFHSACPTDEQRFRQAFNAKDLGIIRESNSIKWYKELAKTKMYHYRPREDTGGDGNDPAINTHLGNFCKASFDPDSDIMSIEVIGDVIVDCRVAEMNSPSWETIWRELHERVVRRCGRLPVVVRKIGYSSNVTSGYIEEINYSLNYGGEVLLRNAIAIRSDDGPFMVPGDSGALVSFFDSEGRQQVFGYGVCEVGDLAAEASASSHEENRSLFICFKLQTALKKLNLATETGCFETCANDKIVSDCACDATVANTPTAMNKKDLST